MPIESVKQAARMHSQFNENSSSNEEENFLTVMKGQIRLRNCRQ